MVQVRTRTRGVVDAKYRLTVEELELFSNQLQTLPVRVQGHEAVEQLLKQVQAFKEEAQKLLSQDPIAPELKKESDAVEQLGKELSKCIEVGLNLDVDLDEMAELKTRQKQVDWLVDVDEVLDGDEPDLDKDGLEQLRDLLQKGKGLNSHPSIESALGKISGLLNQVSLQ